MRPSKPSARFMSPSGPVGALKSICMSYSGEWKAANCYQVRKVSNQIILAIERGSSVASIASRFALDGVRLKLPGACPDAWNSIKSTVSSNYVLRHGNNQEPPTYGCNNDQHPFHSAPRPQSKNILAFLRKRVELRKRARAVDIGSPHGGEVIGTEDLISPKSPRFSHGSTTLISQPADHKGRIKNRHEGHRSNMGFRAKRKYVAELSEVEKQQLRGVFAVKKRLSKKNSYGYHLRRYE